MRVLVVNHTSHASGAEHSMLTLLAGLPAEVQAHLACPLGGDLEQMARSAGIEPVAIRGTDGGLRLHPTQTPRTIVALGTAAIQTARTARALDAEIIHANSVRAGLIAVAAGRLCARPAVVHIRDVLPRGRVADATLRIIARGADGVIAISEHVAKHFADVAPTDALRVIHNPIDLRRFEPSGAGRGPVRRELELTDDDVLLGIVGQITPWKGQLEAVQILAELRHDHPNAHLAIVGEVKFAGSTTRFDNLGYAREVAALIEHEDLQARVRMLGQRSDIPEVMRACDIVLVPSWSEPFGRVVVEAMAAGAAVVATSEGGPTEIVTDGENGVLLAPRDPVTWARTVAALCGDPARVARLASGGRGRAARFDVVSHADAVVHTYRDALARRASHHRQSASAAGRPPESAAGQLRSTDMPPNETGARGLSFESAEAMSSTPYLLDAVMELAGPLSPTTRVLDVGCGNGYWAGEFQRRGCTVVGVDPSASGIEMARAAFPDGRFEQLGATPDLLDQLGEEPFDVIVSTEVVEHLYDPPSYAAGCFAALRPGGRFVLSTPFHGWVKNVALAASGKLDIHYQALKVGGHIKFFSRPTLERLLIEAGFRDLHFVGAGRIPHLWKSMLFGATRTAH